MDCGDYDHLHNNNLSIILFQYSFFCTFESITGHIDTFYSRKIITASHVLSFLIMNKITCKATTAIWTPLTCECNEAQTKSEIQC